MKYYVSFQQIVSGHGRPTDHPSASDHTVDQDHLPLIPNIGDLVHVDPMGNKDAPSFSGRVVSRLFTYFGDNSCGINIVVSDDAATDSDWSKAIKE